MNQPQILESNITRWDPAAPKKLPYEWEAWKRGNAPPPTETERPGLFWYSGFGMGHLYLPDGRRVWCSSSEAGTLARAANVEMTFKDSFTYYQGTYLGD